MVYLCFFQIFHNLFNFRKFGEAELKVMEDDSSFPPRFVVNYSSDDDSTQLNSKVIVSINGNECLPAENNEMEFLLEINSNSVEGIYSVYAA